MNLPNNYNQTIDTNNNNLIANNVDNLNIMTQTLNFETNDKIKN